MSQDIETAWEKKRERREILQLEELSALLLSLLPIHAPYAHHTAYWHRHTPDVEGLRGDLN